MSYIRQGTEGGATDVAHGPPWREEGAYRQYSTDEERRGAGCIGGRMRRMYDTGHFAGVNASQRRGVSAMNDCTVASSRPASRSIGANWVTVLA